MIFSDGSLGVRFYLKPSEFTEDTWSALTSWVLTVPGEADQKGFFMEEFLSWERRYIELHVLT